MSDDILEACEYGRDYLQSPVDDLFSFYYTMQWAAVSHDHEFAAKDIPFELKVLRDYLSGTQRHSRLHGTVTKITYSSSLRPREYGSVLADCHPVLRAWYWELQNLKADWEDLQDKLEGQETKAEIYIPLFSAFAVRGVATLAEIVHKYTKDMPD